MEARKRKIWNRYGLDDASTERETILRQLPDNKCMRLHSCALNPCITAFIAMNGHESQAAGSGDQSAWAQPRDTDAAVLGDNHEEFQQRVRTIHGRKPVTAGRRPRHRLEVQGDREEEPVEAPSSTDSSGRSSAPRSNATADVRRTVHPSMMEGTDEQRVARAEQKSGRQPITPSDRESQPRNPTAAPSVSGGPQAARSTICGLLSHGIF